MGHQLETKTRTWCVVAGLAGRVKLPSSPEQKKVVQNVESALQRLISQADLSG